MRFTIFLLIFKLAHTQKNETVYYYEKLIENANANAKTFLWPKSAEQYSSYQKAKYFGSVDFVVIGGGTGGTVVANRLTENPNWTVLLLEAGQESNNLTDVPYLYTSVDFSEYNWAFNSTPQSTACLGLVNQTCIYPRGKGVGGSSLINGLIYARGYKADFENWAKLVNDQKWGYDSVLSYFKKSEDFFHNVDNAPFDQNYHGTGGYLHVEYHRPRNEHLEVFLEANKELGFPVVDYNSNKLGVSPTQFNIKNGRRFDDGKAFIGSINRKNLEILTGAYVTKLKIRNFEVHGVEFSFEQKKYFIEAKKEVVLCAGVFGTPQILMLSGIGPRQHLEDLKMTPIVDLEVGSTLRDHPTFYGISVSSNVSSQIESMEKNVQDFLNGYGPLAVPNNLQGLGFYESETNSGAPDIELVFVPPNATNELSQRKYSFTDETYEDLWKYSEREKDFNIFVTVLHTKSVGTLRLKSKNPYEYPKIDSKFLSDTKNEDIKTMYKGVELVLRLLETKSFKSINATLRTRLRACKDFEYLSEEYWYCAIRQVTVNLYHPVGTCPMGVDPKTGAVINSELKVFGVKNLRIGDASVFPFTLGGHPHAVVVMVAEQLSDLIKASYY